MSNRNHSIEKAEAILKEGGAETEVFTRATIEAFRSIEETLAAHAQPSRPAITITQLAIAGVAICTCVIGAAVYVASEVRSAAKDQAQSVAA